MMVIEMGGLVTKSAPSIPTALWTFLERLEMEGVMVLELTTLLRVDLTEGCNSFNAEYPNCNVDHPYRIGDGRCVGGANNTAECGFDGGGLLGLKAERCIITIS